MYGFLYEKIAILRQLAKDLFVSSNLRESKTTLHGKKTLIVIRILLMLIETIKYTFRATPNIPKLVIIPFRYLFVELALFTQKNLSNCRVSGLYTRSQFLPMIQ